MKVKIDQSKIDNLFKSESVPMPNRYKVLYARAFELNIDEAKRAIAQRRLFNKRRLNRMIGIGAPKIIIENQRKIVDSDVFIKTLEKVIKSKS